MNAAVKGRRKAGLEQALSEVNDIVEQTYYLEQKVYEFTKTIEANKKKISKTLGRRNNLSVKVDNYTEFFVSKRVKPNVEFHTSQLKKSLSKETYKQVVDKEVKVTDINNLIKLLKEYDVPPREFKKYIETTDHAVNEEISRLIDIGDIEIDDIQGCYDVTFDEEIRVSKIK